jgi:hypothetical protein
MNSKIPVMIETTPLKKMSNLTSKKPVLLFIITTDGDEIDFNLYNQTTIIGKNGDYNFYMLKIEPSH